MPISSLACHYLGGGLAVLEGAASARVRGLLRRARTNSSETVRKLPALRVVAVQLLGPRTCLRRGKLFLEFSRSIRREGWPNGTTFLEFWRRVPAAPPYTPRGSGPTERFSRSEEKSVVAARLTSYSRMRASEKTSTDHVSSLFARTPSILGRTTDVDSRLTVRRTTHLRGLAAVRPWVASSRVCFEREFAFLDLNTVRRG